MLNRKELLYERQNQCLDLLPKNNDENSVVQERCVTTPTAHPAPKGYEKADGVMSYSIICIISEGEQKERDFLKTLICRKELRSVRIEFISKEKQGLKPYQMQNLWERIQRDKSFAISDRAIQLDETDRVFLLSDVDEYYEQLVKIINDHKKEDIGQWVVSNPCFEIWLYYCFCDNPQEDLAIIAQLDPTKRSKKMKQLGHTAIAGGLNPIRAFERMHDGISHSAKHYAEDDKSIPVLYATQVHIMAQFLIDEMNKFFNEYDAFVKQKHEWRLKMKKPRPNKAARK